ncbi:MAG: NADP-dependent oxidoreductase [Gammaproteobacteria bacterium]|nr:NADP-dependent oxidoreductase [Gammaproteobacteria bacterium]
MANRSSNEGVNLQLYLKQVPHGIAGPDDFEVRETQIPQIGNGEVLIRSHYLGVDAALRLIVRDSKDFLFRVQPGDLVRGTVAGEVIESNHPDYSVGELVLASAGMQNYAVSDGSDLERCDVTQAPLASWLGGFGVSGLTAYFAITQVCKPQPGQTVLINGAAGAVGSMAGQIAKLAGARTIGITSSDEKCRWLTDHLGYDVAINYRQGDLYDKLSDAAPDRIDVIFDNVGGEVLDESLRLIGMRGVVLLCGSTSQYSADTMTGPNNYIWLGTMRARMQGFVIFDYADRYAEARARLAKWIQAGQLKLAEHVIDGDIGDFPDVFRQLYEGHNKGKMLIRLPAAR